MTYDMLNQLFNPKYTISSTRVFEIRRYPYILLILFCCLDFLKLVFSLISTKFEWNFQNLLHFKYMHYLKNHKTLNVPLWMIVCKQTDICFQSINICDKHHWCHLYIIFLSTKCFIHLTTHIFNAVHTTLGNSVWSGFLYEIYL